LWKFKYGTVDVYVQLTGTTEEDTLTVWSPLLTLPVQHEADLLKRLMVMNWGETFEARYAITDNQVVVVASRTVADLSPGEISRAITIVATIADENDEPLQKQFPAA
ncbi:MAG: YbjN domain-containing protein, partial [Cyanobacteria bacterium]|nr:YbjN domain-containing protein [Cyanobacteriota bacterium]MDW8203014.1 YbjN domain-containing protein [Cyanobacteriota bacterium SKYGB_h_bin112]